jgi:hypothetical protein
MILNTSAALSRPFTTLAGTLIKIMALPLEAVLSGLAAVFELLLTPITVFGLLLEDLAKAFDKFISRGIADLRRLMGVPTMSGASVGAAVKSANFSSAESLQNKMITTAYGLGTASADERTASAAADIYNWLKSVAGPGLENLSKLPAELGKVILQAIDGLIPKVPEMPGKETASDAGDWASRTWDRGLDAGRRLEDELKRRIGL